MLLAQWELELQRHAPALSVAVYTGDDDPTITCAIQLASYDVILMSFDVFRRVSLTSMKV
jgi:SNF2 family DNA or RNA helicase